MKFNLIALALGVAVSAVATAACAGTIEDVKARGVLNCGSNGTTAGFGVPDDKGVWKGIDVDFCRAVAAAVLGDSNKVKFVPLSAKDRFTALQSKEVDLLARNTTWSMSRDTSLGLQFGPVNYYDGQGFMVRKSLNLKTALDLNGATVCVQTGTTTELNLADYFRANNIKYEPVVFVDANETVKAYDSGRCDAFTTDASGLYAERLKLTKPDDHIVLPTIISKEPLGPAWRQGDDAWGNVIKWTHYAMLTAEELGVTQANVDDMVKNSKNPDIMRLVGTEGKFGEGMGVPNDWAVKIIKQVGNYGEVFERNIGINTPLKITRGVNALWTKGGLQYAPPIR